MSLAEILQDEAKRASIIEDCCRLIDSEVAAKGGISGMAIKAGYKVVQGVKPGFVRAVVGDLLPEFAAALDPLRQEAVDDGQSVAAFFRSNADRVADSLLGITDAKARQSNNNAVKGMYEKLRGSAKNHVVSAVPGLGQIAAKYTTE